MDECIIETLSYFDVFDYPLTFSEIKKFLGCGIEISDEEIYQVIDSIPIVQESNGYYYFLGRHSVVEKRVDRSDVSIQKTVRAKIIAKILSQIPTIDYIGASGSLSMNNASTTDDIDLFFITKRKTLWLTRLSVNLVLIALGQKRNKVNANVTDKICPNMFLDEANLTFSSKRKTLYTAHEIVQLKTLFDRNDTYSFFLNKNKWISNFFPNISIPNCKKRKKQRLLSFMTKTMFPLEKLSYIFQKAYMKKYRSIEVIDPVRAFFHPTDRQKIIMDMYRVRCKRYWMLYDDNLWVDKDEGRFYMEEKKSRILN